MNRILLMVGILLVGVSGCTPPPQESPLTKKDVETLGALVGNLTKATGDLTKQVSTTSQGITEVKTQVTGLSTKQENFEKTLIKDGKINPALLDKPATPAADSDLERRLRSLEAVAAKKDDSPDRTPEKERDPFEGIISYIEETNKRQEKIDTFKRTLVGAPCPPKVTLVPPRGWYRNRPGDPPVPSSVWSKLPAEVRYTTDWMWSYEPYVAGQKRIYLWYETRSERYRSSWIE